MFNLEIYCTALQYFNVLDKLPSYIKPLGLGNHTYQNIGLLKQMEKIL